METSTLSFFAVCRFCLLALLLSLTRAGHAAPATWERICSQLAESPADRDLLDMLKVVIPTAEDRAQGRLTVIYSLGLRYAGEPARADAIKSYAVRNHTDCPELKYLGSRYTSDTCRDCGGKGTRDVPCPACEGLGKCPTCGGQGFRTMKGLNGRVSKVPCPKCRGSRVCAVCGGRKSVKAACPRCRGTGQIDAVERIKRVYVALLKNEEDTLGRALLSPSGTTPSATGGDASSATPAGTNSTVEIDEYMATMKDLVRKHKLKMAIRMDLQRVVADPSHYRGKLLTSRAYLHKASFRSVQASPASASSEEHAVEFIPQSREVGEKVMSLSKTIGGKGRVMITYGVVNEKNLTVFDIESL